MSDWLENKGSGPWVFTPQPNKWGYLNNPRWTGYDPSWTKGEPGEAFCQLIHSETNITDKHFPCGHWHKEEIPSLDAGQILAAGKWVAAQPQPGTPYIYLYDILLKAVIKIDTSVNPPIIYDVLYLEPAYNLCYDQGVGYYGQRGSYCMNKDGTRLWYLFGENWRDQFSTSEQVKTELIEVDISVAPMVKVQATLIDFPLIESVNDGCSDDVYTYWCTSLKEGRIIKIRNADHAVVGDYLFGHPINPLDTAESIPSIDCNKATGKFYWSWADDISASSGGTKNACVYYVVSDSSMNILSQRSTDGSGLSTPCWQNFTRVIQGNVYQHRAYHPFWGPLIKMDLDFISTGIWTDELYMSNLLGIKSSKMFTLIMMGNISNTFFLRCLDPNPSVMGKMSELKNIVVSYYCGSIRLGSYDWDKTAVSAMSVLTGVIAIFRYHNVEKVNHVACFKADATLDLLCDVPLSKY